VKDSRLLAHAAALERLVADPVPGIRALALTAPLSHGRKRSIEVFRAILDHVVPALADDVADVRLAAVHTARLLEPKQRAAVARRAQTDPDRRVRHAGFGLAQDTEAWLAALRDPAAAIREDALRTLAEERGRPDVTAALVRALTDRSESVADAAAHALARRGDPEAGPALLAALRRATTPRRKTLAILALERLDDRSAVGAIAEELRAHWTPDPLAELRSDSWPGWAFKLRQVATYALMRLGGPEAEAVLAELPEEWVRWVRASA